MTMTIYVDMDGVIADFFKELASHHGVDHWKDIPDKEESIRQLQGTDFFGRLPKFKTSDELIEFVDEVTDGKWCILSSPLRGDYDNSSFWKQEWLAKHGYKPKEAIFTGRKEKYAVKADGTPNILIDDRHQNIDRWIKAGGIGIRYQANEHTLDGLKEMINAVLSE
jgi:hypothetical protein